MGTPETFVKFTSHRRRERALGVLASAGLAEPQAFGSLRRDLGQGVYKVSAEHLKALEAAGAEFTYCRAPFDDMRRCWKMV